MASHTLVQGHVPSKWEMKNPISLQLCRSQMGTSPPRGLSKLPGRLQGGLGS